MIQRFLFVATLVVAAGTALLHADAKGDWAKALRHQTATLKRDLPTLVPAREGLLFLTPDGESYYAYNGIADRVLDDALAKIRAAKAQGKSIRMWGWETGQPEPANLVTLKAGSPVTVVGATLNGRVITVWLWDEFARTSGSLARKADLPSTSFSIAWPTKFSKDFKERADIEGLIGTVLDWR